MQDFLSIFMSSLGTDADADDVQTLNSTTLQTQTVETGSSEAAVRPRRPDRPTTLSRPLRLPSCCNYRRQPWRTYVSGEFSYSKAPVATSTASSQLYTYSVDDEVTAAANNDAVTRIIESLDKGCHSNGGYHGNGTWLLETVDKVGLKRWKNFTFLFPFSIFSLFFLLFYFLPLSLRPLKVGP